MPLKKHVMSPVKKNVTKICSILEKKANMDKFKIYHLKRFFVKGIFIQIPYIQEMIMMIEDLSWIQIIIKDKFIEFM